MANIKVELNYAIFDGIGITFEAPCDCSDITGLTVYYPGDNGTVSKAFTFRDAHGNNLGHLDELFVAGAYVKVILNTTSNVAYIQNADTNAYLEGKFKETRELMTRTARIVIGTSTNGWTKEDCDYLCDGVADDVEINEAITSIKNIGGEIVILDGTYDITQTITLYSNMTLRGNGASTILKRGSIDLKYIIISDYKIYSSGDTVGSDNIIIRDLLINGQHSVYSTVTNFGITYTYAKNVIITNIIMEDIRNGIEIKASNNCNINNNIFNDINSAISLSNVKYFIIKGNIITTVENNNGAIHVSLAGTEDYSAYGNIVGNIIRNSHTSIGLSYISYINVIGNICSNCKIGITLTNADYNNISNNICIENSLYSILLNSMYDSNSDPIYCNYNLISNNYIYGMNYKTYGGISNTFVNNKYE